MSNPQTTTRGVSASPEGLWHRQAWMEAVWCSDLTTAQRVVAAVYADHARDKRTSWVVNERLVERSGLSLRGAQSARKALVAAGFLMLDTKGRQHRSDVYALLIPATLRGAPPATLRGAPPASVEDVRGAPPAVRGAPPAVRGAPPATNQSSYQRTNHLSRDESLVADLLAPLGIEREDERISLTAQLLKKHDVRTPGPWLRKTAAEGDLLGLLEGCRPKVDPEDWMNWKPKVKFCTECFQPETQHSKACSLLPCDDCGRSGNHSGACSKRSILLCAGGCGQEVGKAAATMGRPCPKCHTVTALDGSRVEAQVSDEPRGDEAAETATEAEVGPAVATCKALDCGWGTVTPESSYCVDHQPVGSWSS